MTWRAGIAFFSGAVLAWTSIASAPSLAQGFRQVVATQPSPVVSTYRAFPSGGPELREGIKNLVLRDPTLAAEIAEYLKGGTLSPAQREATEQGLADALNLLLLRGEDNNGGVGINPTTAMLIALLAGGVGAGAYFLTKKDSNPVSPN